MKREVSTYTDIELYEFLRGGRRVRDRAFAELYARHSQRIYLYCRRVLSDAAQAEDAFQEAFLRFLKSAESERTMTNVPGFLLRITRNLCLDYKKAARSTNIPLEDFQAAVEDSAVESQELTRLVTMALELLSDEHREAFVLQAYDGMSYAEIAEVINAPISTVRNRVVRAKKKIRTILAPLLQDYRK